MKDKVMQDELENLVNDMRDMAVYKASEDLEYFAEQLEKVIRRNF